MRNAMRIAVIGAGPAGFYATQALLKRFPSAHIDLLERLPVPFGLVRYGVAPDHPATRNVTSIFSALMHDHRDRLRFFGNVTVSDEGPSSSQSTTTTDTTLPRAQLDALYHVVVTATGAASARGLDLATPDGHVHAANDAALWLNGHPDLHSGGAKSQAGLAIAATLRDARSVAIVGVGNVALDIARILLRPQNDRRQMAVAPSAKSVIAQTEIHEVHMFARRAPRFAAWTAAALREVVAKVPGVVTRVDTKLLRSELDDTSVGRKEKRKLSVLLDNAREIEDEDLCEGERTLCIRFQREVAAFAERDGRLDVTLRHTDRTNETGGEMVRCDGAFLSLGYVGGSGSGYRVGWANGSASGIIGDNKWDAETVVSSIPDVELMDRRPGLDEWVAQAGRTVVSWDDWLRIDRVERGAASEDGGEDKRRQLESVEEMLRVAHGVK